MICDCIIPDEDRYFFNLFSKHFFHIILLKQTMSADHGINEGLRNLEKIDIKLEYFLLNLGELDHPVSESTTTFLVKSADSLASVNGLVLLLNKG